MTTPCCPCGSQHPYTDCCEPRHLGTGPAETAEQLMRSRFSAFSLGKIDYLIDTLHPSKRGLDLRQTLIGRTSNTKWTHLAILDAERGLEDDENGEVEFVASYREDGAAKRLHERSQFVREGGRWFYVSGEYENLRPLPKPGRNEPCWCGSGKKFKKCHG